jgi:hypothetical protein
MEINQKRADASDHHDIDTVSAGTLVTAMAANMLMKNVENILASSSSQMNLILCVISC